MCGGSISETATMYVCDYCKTVTPKILTPDMAYRPHPPTKWWTICSTSASEHIRDKFTADYLDEIDLDE